MKHLPLALVVAVVLTVCAFLLYDAFGTGTPGPQPSAAEVPARPQERILPTRQPLGPLPATHSSEQRAPLDGQALRAELEQLASADMSSPEEWQRFMRSALLDPEQVRAALDLLESGALKVHPEILPPGEIGAIRLVVIAVGVYNSETRVQELREAGLEIDGPAFAAEVLRALARIPEPAAHTLAFLRELALDPELSACDRSKLPAILQDLPAAEWQSFVKAAVELGPH